MNLNRFSLLTMTVLFLLSAVGTHAQSTSATFKIQIENVSQPDSQTASDGTRWSFALSPGVFVLGDSSGLLFRDGKAATPALEMQAEDGSPAGFLSSLESKHHASSLHGIFNLPVGENAPGPLGPGASYEFMVTATPKLKLHLALMFGQSNDLFYAPEKGIALFDNKGRPVTGDVTDQLALWDAGTEINEEPGIGPNQAPRQTGPNTGPMEHGQVHRAKDVRFYGKNSELFRVTITAIE